jgi:hypothetical protein
MAVIQTAISHTRMTELGLPDFQHTAELSIRDLLMTLLTDLVERPI